ncbi:hypothetical protein L1281_000484 [Neisseria sp. HSC-16F19]|nr:surface-adhesin E family protein [Neisseria sp. HSC-16F19]MCP2039905.1 hypothetical protein [Neisseria sp. HSC-16F19]
MQKNFRNFLVCGAVLALGACATGTTTGWQDLGLSVDGNIRHALDKSSIVRQGNRVTFRDLKTVQNVSRAQYANLPAFHTAAGTWEIDCVRKTQRLRALTLKNAQGRVVGEYRYPNAELQPMQIHSGQVAAKQFELVCGKPI